MRTVLHLLLSLLAEVAAFLLAFAAAVLSLGESVRVKLGVFAFIFAAGCSFAALFATRWLVCKIPARCTRCGGSSYQTGIKPICYICAECGHVQATRVSSNI